MTSVADAAGHPDVDEISDLAEGLLSAARTAEIQQHLAECADCSEIHAALDELRGLLGSTRSDSALMPDDVAERIDAALATEALLATTTPPAAGTAETRSPTETFDARPKPVAHVSRETSSSEIPGSSTARPAGHPRAATGPGRTRRNRSSMHRRRTIALGTVFTAAAIGLGSLLFQSMNGDRSDSPTGTSASQPSAPGHTFSSASLEGQVTALLRTRPTSTQPDSEYTGSSSDTADSGKDTPTRNTPMRKDDAAVHVPDCIKKGIDRPDAPLAADRGDFEGTDAYLVVLPHPTDHSRVSAYVVDASCTRQPMPQEAGKVLLTRSYQRN